MIDHETRKHLFDLAVTLAAQTGQGDAEGIVKAYNEIVRAYDHIVEAPMKTELLPP